VCDAAEGARRSAPPGAPKLIGCPKKALGGDGATGDLGQVASLFRNRDKVFGKYVAARAKALTPTGGKAFEYYVYGHTHLAEAGFRPIKGVWSPVVMNSGAFQRIVSPKELPAVAGRKGVAKKDALTLQPEDLSPAYDVIVGAPGKKLALRCWRLRADGSYELGTDACR
jgi:hypothetical protein